MTKVRLIREEIVDMDIGLMKKYIERGVNGEMRKFSYEGKLYAVTEWRFSDSFDKTAYKVYMIEVD